MSHSAGYNEICGGGIGLAQHGISFEGFLIMARLSFLQLSTKEISYHFKIEGQHDTQQRRNRAAVWKHIQIDLSGKFDTPHSVII
jgi:hypothetical protein